jgi:hypothetical protein
MNEMVPIGMGLLAGLLLARWRTVQIWRVCALGALSVILGSAATVFTGEALTSWGFVLVDVPEVFGTGLASMVLITVIRRALGLARG